MKLTDEERVWIARRAAGEYGINPAVVRTVTAHRKNQDPDDQVFLDFARFTLKSNGSLDDYCVLAKAVLEIIPRPWGPSLIDLEIEQEEAARVAEDEAIKAPLPVAKPKKSRKCGICSERGHNARTCPSKPDTPTVKHNDGIERLSPGFDPNPPKEIS